MDDALAKGQKVMVISMGSVIIWKQWAIDYVLEGIKELNKKTSVRVLWSLKEDAQ